mmetsp:Transcript_113953/g.254345  ORF Transcript_113953/g.254345 Transcript_113953/m.254345 type:complete len:236 (-) Transcript_113953:828-1535(-)
MTSSRTGKPNKMESAMCRKSEVLVPPVVVEAGQEWHKEAVATIVIVPVRLLLVLAHHVRKQIPRCPAVGARYGLLLQRLEVHAQHPEPGAHLHICRTARCAEALRKSLQELTDEVPCDGRTTEGEAWLVALLAAADRQDLRTGLCDAFVLPWRLPGKELVGEHTKRPPINRHVVAVGEVDHLRGHVLWSADQGVCLPQDEPGEPHVAKLPIAPLVNDHVFGLQVPIDDAPLMEVL